ncbi:MAG: TonB-dependent receptor, partial [Candidatus Electryoneaceae bacterium]|nr:TonB-dependent receptor [Candidatus Electryoneaceae bacterium]
VAYLVDGMEVKDPLYNTRMLAVGSPAVAEMVALTGGFDAEYGNAQSAIINVVTKEGSKDYHGRIRYIFDDLSPKQDSRFETITTTFEDLDTTLTTEWQPPSSYQNYDAWEGSLGGPCPIFEHLLPSMGVDIPGYVTFFASADLTARNTSSNGIRINSSPWYRHDVSGGWGLDDRREQTFLTSNLQLTYHINRTMKLKAGYRFNREWYNVFVMRQSRHFPFDYSQEDINRALQGWTGNDSTYTYVTGADDDGDGRIDEEALNGRDDDLDGRIDEDIQWYEYNAADHTPMRKIDDGQFLLSWSHTLSKNTYYHVKLSRYQASRKITGADKEPWEYGEYEEPFTDMPDGGGAYNGRYDPGEPFEDADGDGIWDAGNPDNNTRNYRGYAISGDGTDDDLGQPVPAWYDENSIVYAAKFQLTSQMHRYHQMRLGLDYNYFNISSRVLPYPTIDNEGQGIYTDVFNVFPSDGAIYFQDKMEFNDITLTAGARLDFYLPGDQVRHVMAFDSTNENWNPNYIPFDIPNRVKANVSPRIGVSFAVTERSYLHAHYGHFYQRPRWNDMFEAVNQPQSGGTPRIGNPDLSPEKTVAFEVGISWNPYQNYLMDVTGFMKDVKNWINTRDGKDWYPEHFGVPLIGKNFAVYDNQDYALARGLEFNLSREYGSNLSGRVTYTLSWVNAKNSYNVSTQAIRGNYVEPPVALPAGWDQRHSIVANFGNEL